MNDTCGFQEQPHNGLVESGLIAPLQLKLPQHFRLTWLTKVVLKNTSDGREPYFLNFRLPLPNTKNLSVEIEIEARAKSIWRNLNGNSHLQSGQPFT